MKILDNFKITQANGAALDTAVFHNVSGDCMTIQVMGAQSGYSLSVLGQVGNGVWVPIQGINLGSYVIVSAVAGNGIYQFGITGLTKVSLQSSNTASTVTLMGTITQEG